MVGSTKGLVLPDLIGMIREVPTKGPAGITVSETQPFAAIFRRAQKPVSNRYAELIVMHLIFNLGPPDYRYMRLLRQQFPSLHQRYRKGPNRNRCWWMNDKDYALMRTFFGGS